MDAFLLFYKASPESIVVVTAFSVKKTDIVIRTVHSAKNKGQYFLQKQRTVLSAKTKDSTFSIFHMRQHLAKPFH